MKIHKGDTVQIMAGKDSGKRGKVLKTNPKEGRILVEGINLVKKHQRPRKQGDKGETVSIPYFFNIAKAMVICRSCDKPARIGHKNEDGKKSRYCKKCQAAI